jgi:hypothetical protein
MRNSKRVCLNYLGSDRGNRVRRMGMSTFLTKKYEMNKGPTLELRSDDNKPQPTTDRPKGRVILQHDTLVSVLSAQWDRN